MMTLGKFATDLLFFTSRGNGAFLEQNGRKQGIEVGKCDNMKDAYGIFGPDCTLAKYPVHNRLMSRLGDIARTTNMNGSCALALGLVAAGRADALIQPLQSPWDWAAGKVLVEEAGGTVTRFDGTHWSVENCENLVYSNGLLHKQILALA